MAREAPTFATIRSTPEVILWGLGIFVAGVTLLPMLHAYHHQDDHSHGPAAPVHAHEGEAHSHGEKGTPHAADYGHGEGSLAHFGLAVLDAPPPTLAPPLGALLPTSALRAGVTVGISYLIGPLRPQGP